MSATAYKTFRIDVFGCRNLPPQNDGANLFVTVGLSGEESQRTLAQRPSASECGWNEELYIKYLPDQEQELVLEVCREEELGDGDCIGRVICKTSELTEQDKMGCRTLTLRTSTGEEAGQIDISVIFENEPLSIITISETTIRSFSLADAQSRLRMDLIDAELEETNRFLTELAMKPEFWTEAATRSRRSFEIGDYTPLSSLQDEHLQLKMIDTEDLVRSCESPPGAAFGASVCIGHCILYELRYGFQKFGRLWHQPDGSDFDAKFDSIPLTNLPKETRLDVSVFCFEMPRHAAAVRSAFKSSSRRGSPLPSAAPTQPHKLCARGAIQIFDERGRLREGPHRVKLWRMGQRLRKQAPSPAAGWHVLKHVSSGFVEDRIPMLDPWAVMFVRFPERQSPVYLLPVPPRASLNGSVASGWSAFPTDLVRRFSHTWAAVPQKKKKVTSRSSAYNSNLFDLILNETDPYFAPQNEEQKQQIRDCVEQLSHHGSALAKYLLAVDWGNPSQVSGAVQRLETWAPLSPQDALQLLGPNFVNEAVRSYAVQRLSNLDDDTLSDYLLQLTQALKYEPYLDSALLHWLMSTALRRPYLVGSPLYWHLRCDAQVADQRCWKFFVYAEQLRKALHEVAVRGNEEPWINDQMLVVKLFSFLSECLANEPKDTRTPLLQKLLREHIAKAEFPKSFRLPICPEIVFSGIRVDKCKVMSSGKAPFMLWLTETKTGDDRLFFFKCGQDIRHDALCLKLVKIMDKIWKSKSMDLLLTPYECIGTGPNEGLIEGVMGAVTEATILWDAGGVVSLFKKSPLVQWLRNHHTKEDDFLHAQARFRRSCAGYCVATYVLGLCDRHNDNVMLFPDGRMFHIDFGRFLGHVTCLLGIPKERSPFLFTPDYAEVLDGVGSATYNTFLDECGDAFNILRSNGIFLLNMLDLMTGAGLPQLPTRESVRYMRDVLMLRATNEQAARQFSAKAQESLQSWSPAIYNAFHMLAHVRHPPPPSPAERGPPKPSLIPLLPKKPPRFIRAATAYLAGLSRGQMHSDGEMRGPRQFGLVPPVNVTVRANTEPIKTGWTRIFSFSS